MTDYIVGLKDVLKTLTDHSVDFWWQTFRRSMYVSPPPKITRCYKQIGEKFSGIIIKSLKSMNTVIKIYFETILVSVRTFFLK